MTEKKKGWFDKFTKQMVNEDAEDPSGTAIQLLAFIAFGLIMAIMALGAIYADYFILNQVGK